jgi:hypothetical protein
MRLEAHLTDANCAACHKKIDPLGLAFDNYDAIGRWRTEEDIKGKKVAVDASGALPDGRKFSDAEGLKRLMLADLDKFAAAFNEKLATYALRRTMTYDDRKALAALVAQGKADGYALRATIERLVLSEFFQQR